jgi:hypothetical protein
MSFDKEVKTAYVNTKGEKLIPISVVSSAWHIYSTISASTGSISHSHFLEMPTAALLSSLVSAA